MNKRTFFVALVLVLALARCSSTRPPAAGEATPPPVTDVAEAGTPGAEAPDAEAPGTEPLPEPEAAPVLAAPEDWFLLDPDTDGFDGARVERTYQTLLRDRAPARPVVVAVIDGGVDTAHVDLRNVLWVNEDEVPGNGLDDDGNGYVDDVHGWNFIGGPDGENVQYDTYEVTRLYAELSRRFADADPEQLPPSEREAFARYQDIEAAYRRRVEEAEQNYRGIASFLGAFSEASRRLREHFGKDDITFDDLMAIDDSEEALVQARDIYLFLLQMGATEDDLVQAEEHLRIDLQYRLNPDFDPRPIVGDDYDDLSERFYGNNDVTGPDAEHGTHVAGIIAAERDNGVGIDGIAPVQVMILRAVPDGDERDKDVANAIRYAADNGAHIINMSFGKAYSPQKEAVDAAVRYADARGVLMVHAAGNDAANVDSTANYPMKTYLDGGAAAHWLTVGAVSWEPPPEFVASFSNFGAASVDLFAPGVDIYSTLPGSTYGARNGTSMAAPVVSGVAALLMAYFPDLTATQVKDILLRSVTAYPDREVVRPGSDRLVPFGSLSATGGVVNAYRAVELAQTLSGRGD
ncbi:hypothetical protein AWN76_013495 [Rhodothermaceae bacterium RA]|nr:hypothetical protein AWN76_013495 [Rhodothermaceae bacterium RA]